MNLIDHGTNCESIKRNGIKVGLLTNSVPEFAGNRTNIILNRLIVVDSSQLDTKT